MPRLWGTKRDEELVYFGSKDEPEVKVEFSNEGKVAGLRLGDAPYALLSWVLKHLTVMEQKNLTTSVPHDLTHANWADNVELFKTRGVWLRIPVSVMRRFEAGEGTGEVQGHSFMCFRVIPDSWVVIPNPEESWDFTYGSSWFQTLNRSWKLTSKMFKQQGGDKISPQERFKLFTFAYSGEGELMDTPTQDIESNLR